MGVHNNNMTEHRTGVDPRSDVDGVFGGLSDQHEANSEPGQNAAPGVATMEESAPTPGHFDPDIFNDDPTEIPVDTPLGTIDFDKSEEPSTGDIDNQASTDVIPKTDPDNLRFDDLEDWGGSMSRDLIANPNRIEYTVLTASKGRSTIAFTLNGEGQIQADCVPYFISGTARTESITYVTDLKDVIARLAPNECLATGVFDIPHSNIALTADLTADRLKDAVRARTQEHMRQPTPGLLLLNHAPSPRMPEHMRCNSPTEFMEKLASIAPEFAGIEYCGAASASNGIINVKTGEVHGHDGLHCYILIDEADLRALREWLRAKCWLGGYGYIELGRNGVMLERCIVDITVLSPERLIYEAKPVLGGGLQRSVRNWTHQPGNLFTGTFASTRAEIKTVEKAVAAAKSDPATIEEARKRHEEYYNDKSRERAVAKSITIEEAKRRWPLGERPKGIATDATLFLDDTVYVNGEVLSVEQLIAQGEALDRTAMPDPIEGPDYGNATAVFIFNGGQNPAIHSFAHGQQICYAIRSHGRLVGIEASTRLDPTQFPNTVEVNGKPVPTTTIPNLRHMLDRYGIHVFYNIVGKRLDIRIPGLQGSPDNIENSALSHIISLCAFNEMKTGQVSHFLAAIGDQAQYNPVAEWICSKPWDGKDRLPEFYATLTTEPGFPQFMKEMLVSRWLMSAIAAIFKPYGFHARGVLVLQGPQSIGKTSWVRALITDPMLRETVIKIDHHLDASNKDSIVLAISHWIVELGELESTMKRNVPRLKGFITSDSDKVRLPYARRESSYQRRTVFCATVNRKDFLVDDTGNARWWTLPVTKINYTHGIDMQQLWAQMFHQYQTETPVWWLSPGEEKQLELLNQNHLATSAIRQLIEASIDFTDPTQGKGHKVVNALSILQSLGKQSPSNSECKECAAVMREQLGDPVKSNGVLGWRVKVPVIDSGNK